MAIDFTKIPPPPVGAEKDAYVWVDWYTKLQRQLNTNTNTVETVETDLNTLETTVANLEAGAVNIVGIVFSLDLIVGTPGATTAQVYLNSDGRVFRREAGAPATASGINWYTPTTTGIGDSYYVYYIVSNESSEGDGAGYTLTVPSGWNLISSDSGCTLSRTFTATGTARARVDYQISSTSDGTSVIAMGTLSLVVGYEP